MAAPPEKAAAATPPGRVATPGTRYHVLFPNRNIEVAPVASCTKESTSGALTGSRHPLRAKGALRIWSGWQIEMHIYVVDPMLEITCMCLPNTAGEPLQELARCRSPLPPLLSSGFQICTHKGCSPALHYTCTRKGCSPAVHSTG
eukprot:1156733-Pelagomonas_calceolata.AAC.2